VEAVTAHQKKNSALQKVINKKSLLKTKKKTKKIKTQKTKIKKPQK